MPLLNKHEPFTELNLPELHKHLFQDRRGCTQEITAVHLANSSSAESFKHQQINYSHHCINCTHGEPYKTVPVAQGTCQPVLRHRVQLEWLSSRLGNELGWKEQQFLWGSPLAAGKSRLLQPVQQPAPSHTLRETPKSDSGMAQPLPPSPQSHSHTRVSMQQLFLNKAESVPLGRRRLHSSYLPMGPQQCSNTVITQPLFFSFVPCYI